MRAGGTPSGAAATTPESERSRSESGIASTCAIFGRNLEWRLSPASIFLIAGCEMPTRLASWACDQPSSSRLRLMISPGSMTSSREKPNARSDRRTITAVMALVNNIRT